MSIALLLTVNLKGGIGGPIKHSDKQIVTVDVSPVNSPYPEYMTKKITHSDRKETICYRKINIEERVLQSWVESECPRWEKSAKWKSFTRQQKIESYLRQFDEGFGISYELI